MKKLILATALLVSALSTTTAQADSTYLQSLVSMFEASGTEQTYQTVISQMVTIYKDAFPQVDTHFWDEMEKEMLKTSIQNLAEMLVPVYEKYLTQDDLEEVIKFYQSPVGKKLAGSTPSITRESMQIGQEWGRQIGEKIEQRLKEEGY